jgi:STE24 endopeptidase
VTARRVGVAVSVLAGIALGVLMWQGVPWQPVPGGSPEPVPATSVFTLSEIARAEDFSASARWFGLGSYAVSLVLVCVLGLTRLGERLINRIPGPWLFRLAVAVGLILVVQRAVTLPWAVAAQRDRLGFGLTDQSWAGFTRDVGVEFAVNLAITLLAAVVVIGAARRWRSAWPAIAGTGLMALTMAASFVYPVVIEPLFNNFEPLPDGPLRTAVLSLAATEDVPLEDVLVADASRRTTSLNAYVSGYGSTRRVVLYDNLVSDVPQDQTLSVVAHELAHARHNDVLVGSALGALGMLCGVGLLGVLLPSRSPANGARAPAREPSVVPLLLALVAIAGLATAPIQNTISRRFETRADLDALAATQDRSTLESLQRTLATRSLADPTPPRLTQWWFGTHPTVLERIALARVGAPREQSSER